MERVYFTAKENLSRFKLDFCCWFAPVRVGLMFVGYINIIIDLVCIMGIANDGLSPTITKVQDTLISDFVSKPIPVLAYAIELAFNVVLLCAVYRRDIVLLRAFLYYTFMAVIMSIMTYSIVLAAVPFHIQLAIVVSILFQMYCVLLIRSVIVELKMQNKNYELPKLVMSSLLKDRGTPCIYDPNSGKLQEVTITEAPKKQEVQITIIDKDEKIKDPKVIEFKKVSEVKLDKDVNKGAEQKKDVKVQIESKENNDEKQKEEKLTEEQRKKEEKRIKEEKKKEEKRIKEEKKLEEKKIKEEKKKEGKKTKEEEKKTKEKDKKTNEEEKKTKEEETKTKEDSKKDEQIITSLILQKYKDEKEKDAENEAKAKDSKKDSKDTSLQTVTEHPKE